MGQYGAIDYELPEQYGNNENGDLRPPRPREGKTGLVVNGKVQIRERA